MAQPNEVLSRQKDDDACEWEGDRCEPELDCLAHECDENQTKTAKSSRPNLAEEECEWQGDPPEILVDEFADECDPEQSRASLKKKTIPKQSQDSSKKKDGADTGSSLLAPLPLAPEIRDGSKGPTKRDTKVKAAPFHKPILVEEVGLPKVSDSVDHLEDNLKKKVRDAAKHEPPKSGSQLAPTSPQFPQQSLPEVLAPLPVSEGQPGSNLPVPGLPAEEWVPPVIPKASNEKTRRKEQKAQEREAKTKRKKAEILDKKQKAEDKKWQAVTDKLEKKAKQRAAKELKMREKKEVKVRKKIEREEKKAAKKRGIVADETPYMPSGTGESAAAAQQPDHYTAPPTAGLPTMVNALTNAKTTKKPASPRTEAIEKVKKRLQDGMDTVDALAEDQPTTKEARAEAKARQEVINNIKKKLHQGLRSVQDLSEDQPQSTSAEAKARNDAIQDVMKKLQEGWESLLEMNTQAAEEANANNKIIEEAKKKLEEDWEQLLATEEPDTVEAKARNDVIHDVVGKIRGGFKGLPGIPNIIDSIAKLLPGFGKKIEAEPESPEARTKPQHDEDALDRRHQLLKEIERVGTAIDQLHQYLDQRSKEPDTGSTTAGKEHQHGQKKHEHGQKKHEHGQKEHEHGQKEHEHGQKEHEHGQKKYEHGQSYDGASDTPCSPSDYPSKPSTTLRSSPSENNESSKNQDIDTFPPFSEPKQQQARPNSEQPPDLVRSKSPAGSLTLERRQSGIRLRSGTMTDRDESRHSSETPKREHSHTSPLPGALKRAHCLSVNMPPPGLNLSEHDGPPLDESTPKTNAPNFAK